MYIEAQITGRARGTRFDAGLIVLFSHVSISLDQRIEKEGLRSALVVHAPTSDAGSVT